MVEIYFPKKLSAIRYDSYLASGWFRGAVMLYKMQMLCIDNGVSSVVNIRLNLPKHIMRKSHEKLYRKRHSKYKTIISKAKIDVKREELYATNKHKFKGFIHKNLSDYLHSGFFSTVFNTYEVAVYDKTNLIAISYFDVGNKAIASLIGLYDSKYQKESLGIYTMLCEVKWANENGFQWYYPGYILDNDPLFNYKLNLGNYQYYNHNKRWSNFQNFNNEHTLASRFNLGMATIEEKLWR